MKRNKQLTLLGFREAAAFLKALADPMRLRIVDLLRHGELSVGEIVERLEIPQPSVSRHLSQLQMFDIISRRKAGTTTFCSIKNPRIMALCENVCDCLMDNQHDESDLFKATR